MTVIATARTRPPGTVEGGVTFVDTPTLLADSDVITVHTPLPPQTNPPSITIVSGTMTGRAAASSIRAPPPDT
jgi:hypothetical protein